jgi:NAD(P)H-quinone oxidoreductase subunit 2
LVGCVLVTAIGGILSSPLFDWATDTVAGTPILQQALAAAPSLSLG